MKRCKDVYFTHLYNSGSSLGGVCRIGFYFGILLFFLIITQCVLIKTLHTREERLLLGKISLVIISIYFVAYFFTNSSFIYYFYENKPKFIFGLFEYILPTFALQFAVSGILINDNQPIL